MDETSTPHREPLDRGEPALGRWRLLTPRRLHRPHAPRLIRDVLMRPIVLAAAVGLAFGACGDSGSTSTTRTVDDSAVESGIKQDLSTSGATVTSVKCPSDVPVNAGSTFDCTVTWSNDATGKAEVTQQGAGRYTYAPVAGSVQIPGATVDKELEAQLAKKGATDATVACPDTIIVKTGTTVTCDVTGGGGKVGGTVTFTFSNAEGAIDASSVETG